MSKRTRPSTCDGEQPGVGEREPDRLERDLALAAPDVLRELDLADAGDRDARHG